MKKVFSAILATGLLAGCTHTQDQNHYNYNEVGQSQIVEYAVVVKVKPVDITGRNTGGGALLGGATGAGVGSYAGNGSGSVWTTVGGAVVGAVAGAAIEQEAANKKGFEYTIVTENKVTKTVVQFQDKDDIVFKNGDRVMLQTTGEFQRLLSTDNLPDQVKRPRGIKIVD